MENKQIPVEYMIEKLSEAKIQFERALDCKHTEFDDLYPYMIENPQFFWYKRYVAWAELLTMVDICNDQNINWVKYFTDIQYSYIKQRIMSGDVLDRWYGKATIENKGL